jgi:putative Mg2+ transporter-C (MgtC) family protein
VWCCAAIGCQGTGGHLIAALATTSVVLAVHVLLRPLGRLVDRAPAANEEAVAGHTVVVTARRKQQLHARALLVEALTGPALTLQGLSTHADAPGRASGATARPTPATRRWSCGPR